MASGSPTRDLQGALWLGLNDGIARVEVNPTVTVFDKTLGLAGDVVDVVRHRDRLYAATSLGVYRLEPAVAGGTPHFEAVPGMVQSCWSLSSTDQHLLAGCFDGVFELTEAGNRRVWASPDRHVLWIHRSSQDPDRFYLGLEDGLGLLELTPEGWREGGRFPDIRSYVRSIVEDDQGHLWLGTITAGIVQLDPGPSPNESVVLRRFGVAEGLRSGWVETRSLAGEVVAFHFASAGLLRLDSTKGSPRFEPDTTFLPPQTGLIDQLREDDRGRVWIASSTVSGVAHPRPEGGYSFETTALRQVPDLKANVIFAEPGRSEVWVGHPHGLARLIYEGTQDLTKDFPVWIRRITTSKGSSLHEGPSRAHPRDSEVALSEQRSPVFGSPPRTSRLPNGRSTALASKVSKTSGRPGAPKTTGTTPTSGKDGTSFTFKAP